MQKCFFFCKFIFLCFWCWKLFLFGFFRISVLLTYYYTWFQCTVSGTLYFHVSLPVKCRLTVLFSKHPLQPYFYIDEKYSWGLYLCKLNYHSLYLLLVVLFLTTLNIFSSFKFTCYLYHQVPLKDYFIFVAPWRFSKSFLINLMKRLDISRVTAYLFLNI